MRRSGPDLSRRGFLGSLAGLGAVASVGAGAAAPVLKRAIPATGEQVPVIGMGSWITFNVGDNRRLREHRVKVLQAFFDMGGGVIDSSPMYGSSEAVIGYCLERIANPRSLFSATKVWTVLQALGIRQMQSSRRLWGVERFDRRCPSLC